PTLVFEVLPSIFHHLPGGVVWSTFFFFLLFLASLTSTISMSEISIAFFTEQLKIRRKSAVILNTAIAAVFGTLCALSFGCLDDLRLFGMTIFNLFDYTTSNIMLPFGGMIISLFVGWRLKRSVLVEEMTCYGTTPFRVMRLLIFLLRWVCPLGIALIFLNSIGII
ncbi:MAG: sodium-dependent transporter, partial [Paramuribaculum sp.]|nr:sodium-dependent transporter [Paramuribaculum sp.]